MNIAWFILVTILIILCLSFIYKKWGLSQIRYSRYFNRHAVFEGEKIEMIDEIANNKLLPLPWLRLESRIDVHLKFGKLEEEVDTQNEAFHRTLFSLMPYQKIKRKHHVLCSKRGYYRLKTVSLTTGDPFGFAEGNESYTGSAEIIVYPRLVSMRDIALPTHRFLGDIIAKRWIIDDPFLVSGVRNYSHGDPMNRINWKATARVNHLQVNKREFTSDHYLMIYLNFDRHHDKWETDQYEARIEKGISYAATLANEALSNGVEVGFGCNSYLVDQFLKIDRIKDSVRIEPENGHQQLNYLLETMAKLAIDQSQSFNQFLQEDIENSRENTDILMITAVLTKEVEEKISKIKSLGNSVELFWLDMEEHSEEGERVAY